MPGVFCKIQELKTKLVKGGKRHQKQTDVELSEIICNFHRKKIKGFNHLDPMGYKYLSLKKIGYKLLLIKIKNPASFKFHISTGFYMLMQN